MQLGQHGGRVQRKFTMGERDVLRGDILTGKEILSMPVANRTALINAGYIEPFAAPDDLVAAKAAEGDSKSKLQKGKGKE